MTFEFDDGKMLTLSGPALDTWTVICAGHSDYLLPGAEDHVLASAAGGLIRGFIPPDAMNRMRKGNV